MWLAPLISFQALGKCHLTGKAFPGILLKTANFTSASGAFLISVTFLPPQYLFPEDTYMLLEYYLSHLTNM